MTLHEAKISEKQVQTAILEWLELHHIYAYRVNNMSGKIENGGYIRSKKRGVCDITGIAIIKRLVISDRNYSAKLCEMWGIRLEIEVKAPGKKPSTEQQEYIDTINAKGGVALYADSIEMLEAKLK